MPAAAATRDERDFSLRLVHAILLLLSKLVRLWHGLGRQARIRSPRLLAAMHVGPHRAWLRRRSQIALVLRTMSFAPPRSASRPLWSNEALWRGGRMRPART